jgi:hypothetical protein
MPDFGIMRGFNEKLFGDKLVAGQLPTQLGLIGSQGVSDFLLDAYPNAAAAYSIRKLRGAYIGSAIRVRRSSDNTEQDIGFTALGNLDTTSLTSFCTGTNGFVTTWYDQSGNANNCVQTTAANQAQIVNSGSVITQGGQPSLLFDGSNDSFLSTTAIDPLFITAVNTPNTTGIFKTIMGADSANPASGLGSIYFQYTTPTRTATFVRTPIFGLFRALSNRQEANTTTNLITGERTSTTIDVYTNNVLRGSGSTAVALESLGGTDAGKFRLMAGYFNRSPADFSPGNLTELIAYTSDQSANRSGISTNINTYYAIY